MCLITAEHRTRIAELCRRYHVRRLDIVGSATRADFDQSRSDLDFLVEFGPADKIERFRHRQTRAAFIRDDLRQSAVERQLAIIGEALRQLSKTAPTVAQQVGDVEKIIGLRNVLIHGYATVDSDLIWRSVHTVQYRSGSHLARLGATPP